MKFGKMIAAVVLSSVCMAGCSSELTDELSRQAAGFAETKSFHHESKPWIAVLARTPQ